MTRRSGKLSRVNVVRIFHTFAACVCIEYRTGAILEYLPPYSPDFNPIEEAFSFMKHWLKRHEVEAVNADVCPWLIHRAILAIPPSHAAGWFKNCGHL